MHIVTFLFKFWTIWRGQKHSTTARWSVMWRHSTSTWFAYSSYICFTNSAHLLFPAFQTSTFSLLYANQVAIQHPYCKIVINLITIATWIIDCHLEYGKYAIQNAKYNKKICFDMLYMCMSYCFICCICSMFCISLYAEHNQYGPCTILKYFFAYYFS